MSKEIELLIILYIRLLIRLTGQSSVAKTSLVVETGRNEST